MMKNLLQKFNIMFEFIQFLWHRKLWWLIPVVVILFVIGLFLILGQQIAILPFVYPLF